MESDPLHRATFCPQPLRGDEGARKMKRRRRRGRGQAEERKAEGVEGGEKEIMEKMGKG